MREIFTFEKRADYPHMNIRDKEIWERFIDKYPDAYKNCQYDFHVGDAPPFNTLYDDETDKNQDMLYRLRIDVVAGSPLGIDIIEVKPSAGPSTIGQVEGYKTLYVRDEEPSQPVGMVIVTDKENPNMRYLCKEKGIALIVV
jgi:hypothetical protein